MSHEPPRDEPFELTGPLPAGVTVLEASAGTGKTFTIAALATRFIASGTPLEQLLLVTFTRMATGELRERVRERLVRTERALARTLAGTPSAMDEVSALLASGVPQTVQVRRERLAIAIADFDAATIATTHSFCQEVLSELGTLGDLEPDVSFAENIDDLVDEVIDDLYIRRFWEAQGAPFDRAHAGLIARIAIAHPTAVIHPLQAPHGSVAAMRARLAQAARVELEARKRTAGLVTYDDLLTRLRDTLNGPHGELAVARLRARYRVVLIDEFQDTDPVQWEIVQRAFGAGEIALVLIADPKQAIYAFRGADVHAYLSAAGAASRRATLQVNWRSDQTLITAFDALLGGARLGHPGIAYRTVRACPAHQDSRLQGAPCPAPLRIRIVDRSQASIELTAADFASAPSARAHIAKDLAADVVALLSSDGMVGRPAAEDAPERREPVRPGHVAVLVQSHRNAALVQQELVAAAVPAVINGAGSVFGTSAARDWLTFLGALQQPASPPRARAAALTPLVGWNAERLACAGEDELEHLHQQLHAWAALLRQLGMAALTEAITLGERLPARLLRVTDGERRLTDLRHVAELLHAAASSEQLGTAALTAWLRQRIAAAAIEGDRDELTRRLESDADAVQVLTIHRSKGLEFPIVYCPFLWEPRWMLDDPRPVFFHDAASGRRAIDVGMQGREFQDHRQLHVREERGEDLRLAYVALTRARHQAVIWWAGSYSSRNSPLGRLVFDQGPAGHVRENGTSVPTDGDAFARFQALGARAAGAISVEWSRLGTPVSWGSAPTPGHELATARLTRRLDARWRRTSYSDITAGAHDAWVGSEPEETVLVDEPAEQTRAPTGSAGEERTDPVERAELQALRGLALPLAQMPAGTGIGTLVHRVLAAIEFDGADLRRELNGELAAAGALSRIDASERELLASGLATAIETPLGAELDATALRTLPREDRLDELEFELPLAGGDDASGTVALGAIAALLRERLDPADPLAGYAQRLQDPLLRGSVRGYLTGSIDLVLRTPDGAARRPRFAIVDYKTNRLAAPQEELSAWHYRPAALAGEMLRSHYALQALLYAAALHRYLRWRLPGYEPEHDLAGVHYLFLRGMLGVRAPVIGGARLGVFSWYPPGDMVAALSDVLDGAGGSST
ncbi:MAG: UvrD-helicase domain-containing protein [Solirubrobacteraceae bacterium]